MARRKSSRRPSRRSTRRGGGKATWLWGGLIAFSVAAFAAIGYAAWSVSQQAGIDAATNCPDTGPVAALAILIDPSAALSRAQEGRLRHEIGRVLAEAPTGAMVSVGMVSEREADRGARIALCKPLSGDQVGALTANPAMVEERFERQFMAPLTDALEGLLGVGQGNDSARQRQQRALQDSLAGTGAGVVDTGSELVITLPEQITFDSGSSTLRAGLDGSIAAIAQSLVEHPDSTVQIVGHTDNIGSLAANQDLSERRAEAVAEVLVREGADPGRIRTLGRADLEPVASNDDEAGRRQNRRVELILATRAPIMESLQALVAETPLLVEQASRTDRRGRQVVIVSDMLQNSEIVSFYRGQAWPDFQASRDFARMGRNLHGVAVDILRLPRDEPAIRDPNAIDDFWVRYFDAQGASLRTRTIGDL